MFDFQKQGWCTNQLQTLGIQNFQDAIHYVQALPYGRNSNRSDYRLVITEGKGTCSTKHAFLKAVAMEQKQDSVQLIIGMYQMQANNTPKIGAVLEAANIAWLPEAHCYLNIAGKRLDITTAQADFKKLASYILEEKAIEPQQIGTYKVAYHQSYLKNWLTTTDYPHNFETVWKIREQCIQALSEKGKL